ncbi:uncharacterized protein F5Z01DRAFT_674327 [Emericellopsis atlantica]|uniref:Uncharacterized protein n=1 Tax=Emericellopsis atlantica TaxID=2614577 RepID=A0A9P7ZL44_9HYPO|nr:uncharacterized protein F5Z01DRAFT_674327 [Emericellopsis atlantica]KAG9254005.1 hypothetical protein F5Z01DRAFT_674327 [Emericellopsis atlantica]
MRASHALLSGLVLPALAEVHGAVHSKSTTCDPPVVSEVEEWVTEWVTVSSTVTVCATTTGILASTTSGSGNGDGNGSGNGSGNGNGNGNGNGSGSGHGGDCDGGCVDGDGNPIPTATKTDTATSTTSTRVTATETNSGSGSGTELALKRDWDIDWTDLSQLELKKSCRMLYTKEEVPSGTKPEEGEPYAWFNANDTEYANLQTVNSKYFQKVWCDIDAGWIKMKFSNWDAYNHAWDNWHDVSRPKWGDYVIITPEESCRNYGVKDQRNFVLATDEKRDDGSQTITCQIKNITIADTVGDENPVDIEFENFNQPGVSAQANDSPGADGFDDLGGEVLADPSGDSDFDWFLDNTIGKMDVETLNQSVVAQFGFTLDDFYGENDLPDLATANLVKRRFGRRLRRAFKKVKAAVKKAVAVTKKVFQDVGDAIKETAQQIGDAIADFTTIDRSISKDINFDTTTLGNVVETPFDGKTGYELFSGEFGEEIRNGAELSGSLDIYCVDCGVEGDFNIRGKVVFVFSRLKFEEGFVEVSGSLGAGLGLGIVAELTLNKEFKKQITSLPLTPFSIPNVFVLGPKFDLSAGVNFELDAQGQLLAGVRADWPSINARIDVVNSGSSFANGFTPELTPIFEVDGTISLTTTFFLEGALGIGIDIANGLFDKSVELIEKPGIFVSAGVGASFSLENGVGGAGDNDCLGVEIATGFTNEVSVNVFDIDALSAVIDTRSFDIARKCFEVFGKRDDVSSFPLIEARQDDGGIGATTFDGGIMSKITTRDEAQTLRLRYSPNGNIYAVPDSKVPQADKDKEWSGWFATDESGIFIYGDSHARFLHGYHDTLLELGVSRLRLHEPNAMPKTSQLIVLATVQDDDATVETPGVSSEVPYLISSDLGGDIYYPILCSYASGDVYPKMFLANDSQTGVERLMSNDADILDQITGAEVKDCKYAPLTNWKNVDVGDLVEE